jgi:capsular polysaccharide transport system ATP-binding protein
MISLQDVEKRYRVRNGWHTVFENVSLEIHKGEKVGILGRNGSGKSTLIRLISGSEFPDSGTIDRSMSVSWPLALASAFQGSLTGIDNIYFIARVYGVDPTNIIPYVDNFSELGVYLREPVKTYSSGMRARLAFAISMAVEFDCFLIDEVIAVGDSRFHDRCSVELFTKRHDRAMVIVSHESHSIREHCDRACVLHDGQLHSFADVDDALSFYREVH